jgi:hypothetical protein
MARARNAAARTDRLTITLADDQRQQIAAIAKKRRTSEASIVRLAVDDFLAAQGIDGSHQAKSAVAEASPRYHAKGG